MVRRGFTLVELMVVVSIIALLLGVLLPALSAARQQARTVKCLANVRTFGQAMLLYTQDHQGSFPVSSHTTGSVIDATNWTTALVKYGAPVKVRACPDDTDFGQIGRSSSYATNDYLEGVLYLGSATIDPNPWARIGRISHPSGTAYAVESRGPGWIDHFSAALTPWSTSQHVKGAVPVERHRGGFNLVFVDGHAELILWTKVEQGYSSVRDFMNPSAPW